MARILESAYRWARTGMPSFAKRGLKALPGVRRLADSARSRGDQWLPVRLGSGLKRQMLLPESFHWISFEGYEPEALAWVAANVQLGDVCLDVGGHLGVYTLLLAEVVGPDGMVYTFEPFGPSSALLRDTLETNGMATRVELVPAAVDLTDGGKTALFVGDSPSEVSVHAHATRPTRIMVPSVSLDAFAERRALRRVDLIKMDIEGAEARALRGATDILRRFRPKVLLEAHGRPGAEALDLLRDHGYTITSLLGERPDPAADPGAIRHVAALP